MDCANLSYTKAGTAGLGLAWLHTGSHTVGLVIVCLARLKARAELKPSRVITGSAWLLPSLPAMSETTVLYRQPIVRLVLCGGVGPSASRTA